MKILVTVKQVPDYETKIKFNTTGDGIVTDGIKWIANPFDEIGVEEGLKIKESRPDVEVVAVTIGREDAQTQLRYALAMGADRGIQVVTDGPVDSYVAAQVLVGLVRRENPDLVIMGKQAIDSDANQTAQLLAGYLGWAQGCFASKVEFVGGVDEVHITREVDGGLETIAVKLPVVISTDLRLNNPRYASLPNIMKAKKKPVETLKLTECVAETVKPRVRIVGLAYPPARKGGRKVADVAELVRVLREEAKVI